MCSHWCGDLLLSHTITFWAFGVVGDQTYGTCIAWTENALFLQRSKTHYLRKLLIISNELCCAWERRTQTTQPHARAHKRGGRERGEGARRVQGVGKRWGDSLSNCCTVRATQLGLALALLVVGAIYVWYSNRKPRSKHSFLHSCAWPWWHVKPHFPLPLMKLWIHWKWVSSFQVWISFIISCSDWVSIS